MLCRILVHTACVIYTLDVPFLYLCCAFIPCCSPAGKYVYTNVYVVSRPTYTLLVGLLVLLVGKYVSSWLESLLAVFSQNKRPLMLLNSAVEDL